MRQGVAPKALIAVWKFRVPSMIRGCAPSIAVFRLWVAVKGLPPLVKNNREEMESVRSNFALVSRLHHPNIAAALVLHPAKDVAYAAEDARQKLRVDPGDTLMVMEYAPGVTLSKWRKQFPYGIVPFANALEIARQIASALDYAHELKIVHRDVKPANVMVETAVDGSVRARILDFGLAAEVRSSMGRVSREIHDTSGTRPYMAPEQWGGDRQGPATDQYALAATFYELVAGHVPFANTFETGDPMIMITVVTTRQPDMPDGLPESVRNALAKALAKKPSDRFTSCCDFTEALEHDAAHMHWSGEWRMPTKQELDDLSSKCDWKWTIINGVKGYVVRGRGNYASASVFLPCAGSGLGTLLNYAGSGGYYWSSVPYSGSYRAWNLDFASSNRITDYYGRYTGQSVRPVQGFTK